METKKDFGGEQKKEEQIKKEGLEKKKNCFCKSKNFPLGFGIGVFAMGIIAVTLISLILIPIVKDKEAAVNNGLSLEEAKVKTEKFINDILIGDGGSKITIKEASEEDNFYKVVVTTAEGQDIATYLTKDGKLFFDQQVMDRIMDIAKIEKEVQAAKDAATAAPAEAVKSDKPLVELFVMSHCPYGTQIEKGILPAVEALGDKIDFELKFCDYAMHGETELNEQLQQHCIKTEEPTKFTAYLECFLEAGDSKSCITKAKINTSKLNSCVSATDKEFNVTKNFADKTTYKGNHPTFNIYKESNEKYAVGGSPTLVINGTTVKSGRNSASLLATICSAFNISPAECSTELSSAEPAPGFGTGASASSGSDASCN